MRTRIHNKTGLKIAQKNLELHFRKWWNVAYDYSKFLKATSLEEYEVKLKEGIDLAMNKREELYIKHDIVPPDYLDKQKSFNVIEYAIKIDVPPISSLSLSQTIYDLLFQFGDLDENGQTEFTIKMASMDDLRENIENTIPSFMSLMMEMNSVAGLPKSQDINDEIEMSNNYEAKQQAWIDKNDIEKRTWVYVKQDFDFHYITTGWKNKWTDKMKPGKKLRIKAFHGAWGIACDDGNSYPYQALQKIAGQHTKKELSNATG